MSTAAGAPAQSQFSPSGRPEKLRLGDVLVQQRLISQEQLQQTLELQRQTGKKVGRLLIETGVITEELLANGLARQMRIPFVNLKTFPFRADVVRLLPESAARRFRALVLEDKGDYLLVAFADSGINLELGFWVADPQNGTGQLRSDINLAIWREFKQAGIFIPFPQREVRVVGGAQGASE